MPSSDPTPVIDRRAYLKAAGGLATAGAAGLAGCTDEGDAGDADAGDVRDADEGDGGSGGDSDSTGVLSTSVTDQPTDIGDFESCVVTLDGVWLGPRTDASEEDEEEEEEDVDEGGDENDDETTDDGDEESGDDEETEEGSDQTTNETTSESSVAGAQPDDAGQNQGDGQDDEDGDEAEEDEDGEESEADDADEDDEAAEEGDDGNGRTYYAFEEPQEADLVELQDDTTQLVDDREVPTGTYQYLQLDVAGVEGVLVDGGEAVVETPGNAPLKFQESFEIREGTRTSFTADFAPVRRGNGEYLIKPVATGTEVSYAPIGESDDETDSDGGETDESSDGGADGGTGDDDEETEDDGDEETSSDDGTSDGGDDTNETATGDE